MYSNSAMKIKLYLKRHVYYHWDLSNESINARTIVDTKNRTLELIVA